MSKSGSRLQSTLCIQHKFRAEQTDWTVVVQRVTLEYLGFCRRKGALRPDLCKRANSESTKFHYVLKVSQQDFITPPCFSFWSSKVSSLQRKYA